MIEFKYDEDFLFCFASIGFNVITGRQAFSAELVTRNITKHADISEYVYTMPF